MPNEAKIPRNMPQPLAETMNEKLIIHFRDISHTMRFLYEGKGSQKRVLIVLRESGTITQKELTEKLGIQSGSASEVIAKLENTGLITRSLNKEDRRTADISLTEEGRRQADEAIHRRQQRHQEMFSILSQEEKMQLLSLLEKIECDWSNRYPGGREQDRPRDYQHNQSQTNAQNNSNCTHSGTSNRQV